MKTQTDSSGSQDFQVQANLPQEQESVAVQAFVPVQDETVQTIKEKNPNSAGPTQSKKRKLFSRSSTMSMQTFLQTSDSDMSNYQTSNTDSDSDSDTRVHRTPNSAISSSNRTAESTTVTDILNSEVYKIYCQNEDPKEAMKQIKNMKTCIFFKEPVLPLPKETVLKKGFDEALKNLLWSGSSRHSKRDRIQRFLDAKPDSSPFGTRRVPIVIKGKMQSRCLFTIMQFCFTEIQILLPNGYEYWYVKNFESGVTVSKWFRGVSVEQSRDYWGYGKRMARLNVIGLTNSNIEKYYYESFEKQLKKRTWVDFANEVLQENFDKDHLFLDQPILRRWPRNAFVDYVVEERTTDDIDEVNVTLRIRKVDEQRNWHTLASWHGKSTRPLKKERPNKEKEEMTKEAKKAALIECFKERFGFTEFNDFFIDELHRPITAAINRK